MLAVFLNEFQEFVDFEAGEPCGAFENDRVEPKLGNFILAPHVDVRRLASVERHEEEPISAVSQYRGYSLVILYCG